MPFTSSAKQDALDAIAAATTHIGLLDRTKTELTGGSPAYARQTITWTAFASDQRQGPTVAKTFDVGPSLDAYFVSGHTALTAGTQKFYWPLGNQPVQYATVQASTDLITSYGHGLSAGHEVIVYDAFGVIPTGLTDETIYYVIATGLTTDAFSVSTTLGGAAMNITADGEMTFQRIIKESFGLQGTLQIGINQITLDSRAI
jgi:hypothetical protein